MGLPPLYAITDCERLGADAVVRALSRAASGGLEWVQVREPGWGIAETSRFLEMLLPSLPANARVTLGCRPGQAGLERADLARRLGLSGVHVGGGDPSAIRAIRDRCGPGAVLGYSAHSLSEGRRAAQGGVAYVSLSPVFAPLSKRSPLPPLGLEGLRDACGALSGAVYALGGVTPERVAAVRSAGAAGIAAISLFLDASDPEAATRDALAAWRAAAPPPA